MPRTRPPYSPEFRRQMVAFDKEGTLWAAGGEIGSGRGHVWRVAEGGPREWAIINGARFVNGIAFDPDGQLLVADSILGAIHAVRTDRPEVGTWLQDDRLRPTPESQTPGANGIKLFGSHALISITDRNRLVRVAIGQDGQAARWSSSPRGCAPTIWRLTGMARSTSQRVR